MKYDEFISEFGHSALEGRDKALVRKWKQRDTVPLSVVTSLRTAKNVTPPPVPSVTSSVTRDIFGMPQSSIAVPSAEKNHPEFDIMDDGWARGFACDILNPTNRTYRTAHAIRRFTERDGGDPKGLTQEFWENHSGSVEDRLAFFRELDSRRVGK